MRLDLQDIPLVDGHCHPPLRSQPTTVEQFRTFFTESRDPRIRKDHVEHTLFYQQSIRDLAEFLDCEPDPPTVLSHRAKLGTDAFIKLIVHRANISGLVVDYGYRPEESWSHEELSQLLAPEDCEVRYVLRLEPLMEKLVAAADSFDQLVTRYAVELADLKAKGVDALKTIVAYRSGLDIGRPEESTAAEAFARVRDGLEPGQTPRLESKPLLDHLLLLALEQAAGQGVPVQFHTALGDVDIDLLKGNPLHLRPLLQDPALRDLPIVLLHCYPYLREAAYLSNMYGNVYVDLSMTLPVMSHTSTRALEDVLGLAPTSKVLYGSDAPGLPDYLWLGAVTWRGALGSLLGEWVEDHGMPRSQAMTIANQVLHENARDVYG